jgi:hypothetical protein
MADEIKISDVTAFATGKAGRSVERTVFIDVGAKRIDANVSRDGLPVGVFRIDKAVFDDIVVTRRPQRLRVVSQSVPPGTAVPLGASIDLVMAPAGDLPIGIVTGTHAALKELPMDAGFDRFIAGKALVPRILARAAAGPLSREDEQAVADLFAGEQVPLTDQPGRDVTAAVETLRALNAFGG